MKNPICLNSFQFALTTSLAALCGAGLMFTASHLRVPAAQASVRRNIATTSPELVGGKAGKVCPVVHFEIGCKDLTRTKAFYSQLFDWKIGKQGPADVIDTGSKEGIQGHLTSLGHEPEHYVTFYVQVGDIRAALEKAKSLGGKTVVPPIPIPTGQFAWFSDPDGNIIALIQPKNGK